MRLVLAVVILFLSVSTVKSATRQLSDSAEISLLTCSPGEELYSVFGHSAIRVIDPDMKIDWVFNYGTFDFDTPNFYLKFSSGQLNYILSVTKYSRFVQSYFREERSVYEQVLNLTPAEKQKLFDALIINYKPENRYYRYDFFFDNCATRIRDIIIDNVEGQIKYVDPLEIDKSFRDYIHEYMNHTPWISDGLDLLLGVRTDRLASVSEQMFLPDYMMHYFNGAKIINNGKERNLVKGTNQVLKFEPAHSESSGITPSYLFWGLLIFGVILTYYEIRVRKKPLVFFTRILLFVSGAVGILLFYLWFLSLHGVTGQNYNLLWAIPINFFIAFLPLKILSSKIVKYWLAVTLASLTIQILAFPVISQDIPLSVIPFTFLMLIRIAYLLLYLKKSKVLSR